MKKIFLSILLLAPFSAHALYNGNPVLPQMPRDNLFLNKECPISLKINYEGDFLLGRKIKSSAIESPSFRSMLNGGEFSFGILDRVELYTLLGAFKNKVSGEKNGSDFHIKTKESFGGQIGVRALAIFWGDIKVGLDGKYFYGWPRLNSIYFEGVDSSAYAKKTWQQEWQVGVSISQTFAFVTPYVGAKCARFKMTFINVSEVDESVRVDNVSPFGLFIGLGFAGKKGAFMNLEARFLDEYALTAALGLRF
jgi:hypothetical protein